MPKLICHPSTPKKAAFNFVVDNIGNRIQLLLGDNTVHTYDTSKAKQLAELLNTIKTHYIHCIETI